MKSLVVFPHRLFIKIRYYSLLNVRTYDGITEQNENKDNKYVIMR